MGFDLDNLVRENVKQLVPYSSARSEFNGRAKIFLDANENSFGSPIIAGYPRYPDPFQTKLKARLAELLGIQSDQIYIGNGSDEAIDLLFRVFCRPQIDNVVICPPTYGMYEVAAAINDTVIRSTPLTPQFQLDIDAISEAIDDKTKLIFVCSPNNPTGNSITHDSILHLAAHFSGLVVVDEAYIHFSDEPSSITKIKDHPNLVVLQTFSKAWGMAGLRVGTAFANAELIAFLNKVKPPYNVSQIAQNMVFDALKMGDRVKETIAKIVEERRKLERALAEFTFVTKVYPSETNFLLVKMTGAKSVYGSLVLKGIVVRDRSNIQMCDGCLRITVGTPNENKALLNALEKYEASLVY